MSVAVAAQTPSAPSDTKPAQSTPHKGDRAAAYYHYTMAHMYEEMVTAYGIVAQPALVSRHTQGRAVDMDISWTGTLTIAPKGGAPRAISSTPRTGENKELHAIGASYGVIKATFAGDPPHWSDDGH